MQDTTKLIIFELMEYKTSQSYFPTTIPTTTKPAMFMHNLQEMFRDQRPESRSNFLAALRKGDILISKSSMLSGMVGHAAIMGTDLWVIEMPGGGGGGSSASFSSSSASSSSSKDTTLEDNNRRISKHDWYDEHSSDKITVYRCPSGHVARQAADWAYENFYNPSGGDTKTIHIRYSLTSGSFFSTDPCYCSKLVLLSYYRTNSEVLSIGKLVFGVTTAIVPNDIPSYFEPSYALEVVGYY